MHENDAGRGRPVAQPFAPRLVRDEARDEVLDEGGPAREIRDPAVREIADSLADLFLGPSAEGPAGKPSRSAGVATSDAGAAGAGVVREQPETRDTRPSRAIPAPVEMVVLGHLPVLAGAWLTQYATQAAQSLGKPIALARLEPGGLSIDLFGVPKDVAVDRRSTLSEALDAARGLVGGWLLRVDELAEAGLAESPRVGSITLLSGVSESSIVAAYRTLKAIAQRAGNRASEQHEERDEPAELRIALLGATAERARDASGRIRKAAATFLGRPVGVIVCAERIGLTSMRSLYRGGFEGDGARLLEMVGTMQASDVVKRSGVLKVEEAPNEARHIEIKPSKPAPRMLGQDTDESEIEDATGLSIGDAGVSVGESADAPSALEELLADDDWLLEPETGVTDHSGVQHTDAGTPSPTLVPTEAKETGVASPTTHGATVFHGGPTPTIERPGVVETRRETQDAQSYAALLGLSPLPIRCPDAPRVELAVDSGGGLHALALDELSAGMQAGRAGVAALLAADAWARTNMDLLSRAMPFVKGGEVSLHLLTRVPAASRDLLGTRVKVHLLARASEPGDVCVGLN